MKVAKSLGDSPEIKIAESFVLSQKGDKATALNVLAGIDSDKSRAAGLIIVSNHDGAEGAIQWMNKASYTAEDLDSDGKFLFLNRQFLLGHWDDAAQTVSNFSETDFEETPVLHHLAALKNLITAVPPDFRCVCFWIRFPFQAARF